MICASLERDVLETFVKVHYHSLNIKRDIDIKMKNEKIGLKIIICVIYM